MSDRMPMLDKLVDAVIKKLKDKFKKEGLSLPELKELCELTNERFKRNNDITNYRKM